MATLQNSVQISESSFEEVYSTSYSHGLESIYKLESVDLKSIRKLSVQIEPVKDHVVSTEWEEDQFSLNLGAFYQGWMVPFTLSEPIQVLQLAKPVEKSLIQLGFRDLRDLRGADLFSLKLGQGHIVDIRSKLKSYLLNKPLEKTTHIDFCSLAKCIFADKDPCKAYVLLETYGLHEWISLIPSESAEVKRSTLKQKKVWREELLAEMDAGCFTAIMDSFVKPWMYARGGIATQDELIDYLILRSSDEVFAKGFLELFKDDVFSSLLNLQSCFALSKQHANHFRLIEMTGLSYFNQPDAEFSLSHFAELIAKELGRVGHPLTPDQIFKVVKISNYYTVYRSNKGDWRVQEDPLHLKT